MQSTWICSRLLFASSNKQLNSERFRWDFLAWDKARSAGIAGCCPLGHSRVWFNLHEKEKNVGGLWLMIDDWVSIILYTSEKKPIKGGFGQANGDIRELKKTCLLIFHFLYFLVVVLLLRGKIWKCPQTFTQMSHKHLNFTNVAIPLCQIGDRIRRGGLKNLLKRLRQTNWS